MGEGDGEKEREREREIKTNIIWKEQTELKENKRFEKMQSSNI